MSHRSLPSTQHLWPAERNFDDYDLMSGGILCRMINEGNLTKSEIIVDVGPGKFCSALTEMIRKVKGIVAFAIAPHIPEEIPKGITFHAGTLPDGNFSIHNAKLITDIFSGVSYASRIDEQGNIIPTGHEVLIRLATWLKPGGVLIACTEIGRLGNKEDQNRITDFFFMYMGLSCEFETYQKFAEGNQREEDQLRITIRKPLVVVEPQNYEDLIPLATKHIGQATCGNILWESREKDPRKRMCIYETKFMHETEDTSQRISFSKE